ncbi:alpha/beta hydrolase [Ruminococcus sp. CLA-AA-H200]|uniref:Alpha/beta hydrolase n=1 Tax=Ruminococcus turbiniformis TaxID=2881258 RepID=A0ABS8FWX5_9FIRM|nr:alpha/beta hydrolase [Ruminococcus turbiniformis]MCC2253672.1 alpha/beta hydrolase [Ruminococcus turbiniformis]
MDIQLYYTEKGNGTPLILLHGNGEDSSYFGHQTEYFSQKYRVIALDTRGHGRSPRGSEKIPFTIRQFAEDLHDFMDEKGIDRAHILGFSDGGNIALVFALKYPERVDHLILNGANLDASGVKPSVQIPVEVGYRICRFLAKRERSHDTAGSAVRKAEILGLMVNDPNIRPEELSENKNPDFVNMPKLVIAGNKDMIKDEHTRLIYASLPNAQIRVLEGSHFIAKENPEEFNRAVAEFLE